MKKLILTVFASIIFAFMKEHIFGSPYSVIPEVLPPTCLYTKKLDWNTALPIHLNIVILLSYYN